MTLAIFLVSAYLTIAFNWTYSDGNRAGYIQKFSRKGKGWMCKTHEGELAMTTVSGKAGHVVRLITGGIQSVALEGPPRLDVEASCHPS